MSCLLSELSLAVNKQKFEHVNESMERVVDLNCEALKHSTTGIEAFNRCIEQIKTRSIKEMTEAATKFFAEQAALEGVLSVI